MRWLKVDALHNCWAHVVIDQMPILVNAFSLERTEKPSLVFAKDDFETWPHNKKHVINGAYSGARRELLAVLGAPLIKFEHLGFVARENVTIVKYKQEYSIWDCNEVYSHRGQCGENRVPLAQRVLLYHRLRHLVLSHFVSPRPHVLTNVTIVDRRTTRKLPTWYLNTLLHELARFRPNIVFFEHMPFIEQVRLVQTSHIMVMRHGAGEANLLFARHNSIHIEINSQDERKDGRSSMYASISPLANCQHMSVNVGTSLRAIVHSKIMGG